MNLEDVFSIFSHEPPLPSSYPCSFSIYNGLGIVNRTVNNEDEFRAMVIWLWDFRALGVSQIQPGSHKSGSEDSGIIGQTNDGK